MNRKKWGIELLTVELAVSKSVFSKKIWQVGGHKSSCICAQESETDYDETVEGFARDDRRFGETAIVAADVARRLVYRALCGWSKRRRL